MCIRDSAVITHRNLVCNLEWRRCSGHSTAADRILLHSSLSFDVAVCEIFSPLLAGGVLVVAAPDVYADIQSFAQSITTNRVTVMYAVPSFLQLLIEDDKFVENSHLRYIIAGGETLSATLRNRILERLDVTLVNAYGPTETTIGVVFHHCQKGQSDTQVPIGRPMSNTQLYIADRYQQLVPSGHPGELYIGGDCVGKGYLNRLELNRQVFIDNPFRPGSGRVYRTGDLVRYKAGHGDDAPEIEFLGRIDNQIKLRGFRIEPGEIEAALINNSEIDDAVVVLNEESAEPRLVAYFVKNQSSTKSTQTESLDIDLLKSYLAQSLPHYMVPAVLIPIDSIPKNINGKRNLSLLPRPGDLHRIKEHIEPNSRTEKQLASIWKDLLDIEEVGLHDDFFQLGGHSLIALKTISRIKQVCNVDLALRTLLEYSTLESLSQAIDNRIWLIGSEQHHPCDRTGQFPAEEGEI